MRIGTDIDMSTNIKEGYMILEFKKRDLINKGQLNPDADLRFIRHLPDYILEEQYGTPRPVGINTIYIDVYHTPDTLWELYQQHKESIDETAGLEHEYPTNEYQLVSLASDVDGYCGLE